MGPKPANVLLDEELHAHLSDLGLARAARDADACRAGGITLLFMPPEQACAIEGGDLRPVRDAAGDVYALGVTLYRLFHGGREPAYFARLGLHGCRDRASMARRLQHLDDGVRSESNLLPAQHPAGSVERLLCEMLDPDPAQRPTATVCAERFR